MGIIKYSISGEVRGRDIGHQQLTGSFWFVSSPQLLEFSPEPGLEYHVIYQTCYVFTVGGYFAFCGAGPLRLHLPGAGLFDMVEKLTGAYIKDELNPSSDVITGISPSNAIFYDENNIAYPNNIPENNSYYLQPPNSIKFDTLNFEITSDTEKMAVGESIFLHRL